MFLLLGPVFARHNVTEIKVSGIAGVLFILGLGFLLLASSLDKFIQSKMSRRFFVVPFFVFTFCVTFFFKSLFCKWRQVSWNEMMTRQTYKNRYISSFKHLLSYSYLLKIMINYSQVTMVIAATGTTSMIRTAYCRFCGWASTGYVLHTTTNDLCMSCLWDHCLTLTQHMVGNSNSWFPLGARINEMRFS